ncbi:HIT family protein [Jiella sp. MQZ9-1]|uniref:HIT domain-containing protein n=1 Tax=Jiella flava TaxID=2816857 RepID=A0A939JRV1_9HYPH|nr:HIT family protein [Jiella flava]MBO0662298.1 HIT domain-containing protein [Jiella flava]MCD2470871.1 HIT family protein [Jiella flava]
MRPFQLDPRLRADTAEVGTLGLCKLVMMNDRRWPWLILVPQRPDITEIHDLTPLDQTMLTFETCLVAKALKTVTKAEKINVGALGNIVQMLHVHVIARHAGDPGWPGPVWGHGQRDPYDPEVLDAKRRAFANALLTA